MVSERRLVLQSLTYYWRTNLAILCGVIAGTAVIGGALVTGDSVRESLRQLTRLRLGEVDFALQSPRFFRADLADRIQSGVASSCESVAPALILEGSFERDNQGEMRRASGVDLYGIDERGWSMLDTDSTPLPADGEVVLSWQTASDLDVQPGDDVSLWVELPSSVPRDSLLGERDEVSTEIVLTVSRVLDQDRGANRFSLRASQKVPRVAFINLTFLQDRLDLSEIKPTPRDPYSRPARVNALFARAKSTEWGQTETANEIAGRLNARMQEVLELSDLQLKLEMPENERSFSLTSDQMILERGLASAAEAAAKSRRLASSGALIYLADEIRHTDPNRYDADTESGFSMYSVVAGIDPAALRSPFGPYPVQEGSLADGLAADEIAINAWLAEDLQAQVGDRIQLSYHVVGSHGKLPEEEREFRVKAILSLEGATVDPSLVPVVRGITDRESIESWEQPYEMQLGRVTDRDDEYWKQYRTLPKVFLSLESAQELWSSRYGNLTSVRYGLEPDSDTALESLSNAIITGVSLPESGLQVRPVKWEGLQAAVGANDFSQLFFAFSFFLILAAAILIGLLFRLGLERRASSVGLLSALGVSPNRIRLMILLEAGLLIGVGGLFGTSAAVGYGALMVKGLTTWWVGAIGTTSLTLSITPSSLIVGFLIAATVTGLVTWWSMRRLLAMSPRSLMSGETTALASVASSRDFRRNLVLSILTLGLAVCVVIAALLRLIPTTEAFSGFSWQVAAFFVVGLCLLTGSMFLFQVILVPRTQERTHLGAATMGSLGVRNAVRNRSRSVATVGLIGFACFVIVAVAAGHRNPAVERPDSTSGNGGFSLVAESSLPVLYDLSTEQGRENVGLTGFSDESDRQLVNRMYVESFRVKPGEDSSCLNLYRTQLPTILGVTESMLQRGGFKFADTPGEDPWELLNGQEQGEDGIPTIPVFGDLNTLQYGLKLGLESSISVPDETEVRYRLKVAGMLDSSIFQGVLLMSEENFNSLYPEQAAGYEYFLVGLDDIDEQTDLTQIRADGDRLGEILETKLNTYGFDVERVSDRIAAFLEVQNTYLSTFQALGSLGLLLGTFGLATVMLRNVLERRSELALMRAVGFQNRALAKMVVAENALLLFWGLIAGSVSALVSMLPHLLTSGADVPWLSVSCTLGGVCIVGMLAALAAVREAIHTPIVETLRSE